MKLNIWQDNEGDVWIEYPSGSKQLTCMDKPVMQRVADKFGSSSMSDVLESGCGPLQELGPKVDLTGWVHYEGYLICPQCEEFVFCKPDMSSIITAAANHRCTDKTSKAKTESNNES